MSRSVRRRATRWLVTAASLALGASAVIGLPAVADAHPGQSGGPNTAACSLGDGGHVKHVIYVQFDNTHLHARQGQRAVRPRADAAPAVVPAGQRHAPRQRPHDPHLPHGRRHPVVAHRRLPGSPRTDGLEQLRPDLVDRRVLVPELVRVLDGPGRGGEHADRPEHGHAGRQERPGSVGPVHPRRLRRRRGRDRQHGPRERPGDLHERPERGTGRSDRRHHQGLR